MYVCVCACVYVRVCIDDVCMYVCVNVCMHVGCAGGGGMFMCVCVCIDVCVYGKVYATMCVGMYACVYVWSYRCSMTVCVCVGASMYV